MSYLIQKINKINQKSCIIAKCKHKKDALLIIKSLNNNVGNYIFKIFEKEKYKTFNTYDELISYTEYGETRIGYESDDDLRILE